MPVHFAAFIQQRESPGALIVAQFPNIGPVIDDLLLIWAATEADEWKNILEYLPL